MIPLLSLISLFIYLLNDPDEEEETENAAASRPPRPGFVKVPFEKYPYVVALRYCGYHLSVGSIISKNHVLTAAHRLKKATEQKEITVVTGTSLLDEVGQTFKVEKYEIHPDYQRKVPSRSCYDIALVQIKGSFNLNERILEKIEMTTEQYDDTQKAFFAGWERAIYPLAPATGFDPFNERHMTELDFYQQLYEGQVSIVRSRHSELPMINGYFTGAITDVRDVGTPLVQNNKIIGTLAYTKMRKKYEGMSNFFVDIREVELFINQTLERWESPEPDKRLSRFYVPTPKQE